MTTKKAQTTTNAKANAGILHYVQDDDLCLDPVEEGLGDKRTIVRISHC